MNDSETIPIREGEDFDRQAFETFLRENISNLPDEPMRVRQFPTGVSNLTYLIKVGDWEAVMRRPPDGPLPPKAHDMKRESRLLQKLSPHYPYVPKPYVFSEDKNIIGVPFYIMERKKGFVLDHEFPPGQSVTPDQLRALSHEVVNALAALHSVDYKEAGLSDFGYPEGFLQRQVNGWIARYEKYKTEDIANVEQLRHWFVDHIPMSNDSALIHNDYKLNNMLLSYDLTKIEAILDWEMATIADPLFDLAGALGYWVQDDDPDILKESLPSMTATPGFLRRDEFIHLYSLKTKKEIPEKYMTFYMAFTYFKLAVVFQQIYYRWKIGQSKDQRFASFDKNVRNMMTCAYEVVNKNSH